MLQSIFAIFLFQLVGEMVQKYFALTVPGPVPRTGYRAGVAAAGNADIRSHW
jgi:hypothetical protein